MCRQNKNTWFPIVQCLKTFHYLIYIFSFSTFKTEGGSKICLVYIKYIHAIVPTSAYIVELEKVFINSLQLKSYTFEVYNVTPTHFIVKQLSYELFAVRETHAAGATFFSP